MRTTALVASTLFIASALPAQDEFRRARQDIERLASREFVGRSYAFDGNNKAGDFLKARFREMGLEPVGTDFGQPFEIELNVVEGLPRLSINDRPLILGTDFLPFATSGSGSGKENAPVYYVKSGLFFPNKNINDFAGVGSKGAILIFDDEIPPEIQSDTSIDRRYYSRPARIAIAAALKADAAVFLVKRLMYSTPNEKSDVPVFDLLQSSLPNPVDNISFQVESSMESYDAENIIGMVRGTGKSDSTIIVCAHYDHLGGFADSLYFPGANDNASGTAMLLALAEYFSRNPIRYSIVFIAFSGEDVGLVGSTYYAQNPSAPLEKTKFLLNLDMVASGDDGVMAVGGENFPEYYSILKAVNDTLGMGPLYKRWDAPNGDHYPISQKGVKTFFLYANHGNQPYHSFLDVPATLDWRAFGHIYRLSRSFIRIIAN
jgi:hypothetical protein